MSNDLSLDAQTKKLTDMFKDFYVVPKFQREYVWQGENVQTLLNDVTAEFERAGTRDETREQEYFLGSIVVCRSEDGISYDLIDGQQRMTTLYLIFCAIRDVLQESEGDAPTTLNANIRDTQVNPNGEESYLHRVTLQYDDGKEILEFLGNGKLSIEEIEAYSKDENLPESTINILAAYLTIRDFIKDKYTDALSVKKFWGNLLNFVKLIRIVTPDLAQALQIFETINVRGVSLDAMDLLKNLLFMSAPRMQDRMIAEKWKRMLDDIRQKEKPLRFLRYFILALYDVESDEKLTESEIYPWFRENPEQHRIDENPVNFLEKLVEYSNAYIAFIDNKSADGKDNHVLKSISLATTTTARQHFILLMAVKHLPPIMFTTICEELEKLLYCYLITRQRTNVLERNIVRWAQKARNIYTQSDLELFLEETIRSDLRRRRREFDQEFINLSLNNMPKYRVRYTLGKIVQHVEKEAGRTPPVLNELAPKRSGKNTPQIEHILPYRPSEEILDTFDKPDEYDRYSQMLGNLTLLEKTINSSVSNSSFQDKLLSYTNSGFLLTSSIVEKPYVGTNTKFNRGTEKLVEFDTWNSEDIESRQQILLELAREIWMDV